MPHRARMPRSRAPPTGTGQGERPTWRLPTQPCPGGVGPAPMVATENATPEPRSPALCGAIGTHYHGFRRRITDAGVNPPDLPHNRAFCGAAVALAPRFRQPGYDPMAAQDQAFGDGSPETASNCDRRTRSRWA